MSFVKFFDLHNNVLYVETTKIEMIEAYKGGTNLLMDNGIEIWVKGTPNAVLNQIKGVEQ